MEFLQFSPNLKNSFAFDLFNIFLNGNEVVIQPVIIIQCDNLAQPCKFHVQNEHTPCSHRQTFHVKFSESNCVRGPVDYMHLQGVPAHMCL